MTSAFRQPVQTLARPAQNRRSIVWSLSRGGRALVDGELLAQGQVLEGELAMAAEEEGEKPKQVEEESDHEPRLWPDRADRSITCRADDLLMAKDRRAGAGGVGA
jgi:hypothetical protein